MEQLEDSVPRKVGRFRIVDRIGQGGMGQVYLGLSDDDQQVAVKVLHPWLAADPEYRPRFRQEIEAARRVSGRFTVPVVDADPDAPAPWLATQYIDAPSLSVSVRRGGPLSPAQVRDLGAALAEGLADIHQCGLVHRDLKPENILIADDGPRIIDFGVARAGDMTRVTRAGLVIGTPLYMSPEQIDSGDFGPPSDVFSLGSVLVYAATGHGPFGISPGAALSAVNYAIVHKAPDLRPLPGPLRDVISRCLAKDPGKRPAPADLVKDFWAIHEVLPAPSVRLGPAQSEDTVAKTAASPSARAAARPLPARREQVPRPRLAAPRLQVRPTADPWWCCLAADPAGRWIAASDSDGTIALWDAATAAPVRSWPAGMQVRALAASGGNWLGAAGNHGDVRVWDAETGTACATVDLSGDVGAAYAVRVLALDWPGGLLAAASGDDQFLRVWDVTAARAPALLARLPCAARPMAAAFDDAGKRVAAGCADGGLRVWDLTLAGRDAPADTQQVQPGPVLAVAWEPTSGRWRSAGADGGFEPRGAAALSATGLGAATDGSPGRVHAFPLAEPGRRRRMEGASVTLAGAALARPDLLLAGGSGGVLYTWAVSRGTLRPVPSQGRAITAVAAAPDGTRVAVCDDSPRITVFDVTGERLVERWRKPSRRPVTAVAFSPDGGWVVTAGDAVRAWQAANGTEAPPLPDGEARVRALAFNQSGERLAAAGADGLVRVWRGARLWHTLAGHKGDVYAVAFRPDGSLVSTGADETVRMWDLTAGEERGSACDLDYRPRVLAVNPGNGSVAVGCADGTVRLCKPPHWADAAVLDGHVHAVTSVCFGPLGADLVTASLDGTARAWDLSTRSVRLVLAPEPGEWAAAVRTGDGSYRAQGPAGELIWQALGLGRRPLLPPTAEDARG